MKKIFNFSKMPSKKAILIFVLTVLIVTAAIDVTLAIIKTKTNSFEADFSVPNINIAVMWGDRIVNSGDVPVYIRATIVANWVSNKDGASILATAPIEGVDYTVTLDQEYWFMASDGFYYDKRIIEPDHPFAVQLVKEANQLVEKEGYTLRLQIISSAIQATPVEAVESTWSAVDVVDGQLQPASTN